MIGRLLCVGVAIFLWGSAASEASATPTVGYSSQITLNGTQFIQSYQPNPINQFVSDSSTSGEVSSLGGTLKLVTTANNGFSSASIIFADELTFTTSNGANGIAEGSFTISGQTATGTVAAPTTPEEFYSAYATSIVQISALAIELPGAPGFRLSSQSNWATTRSSGYFRDFIDETWVDYDSRFDPPIHSYSSAETLGQSVPVTDIAGTYPFRFEFRSGVPFRFSMSLLCITSVLNVDPVNASCEFGNSLRWNGLSRVTDSQGAPLAYQLQSSLGGDFAGGYGAPPSGAVPEPDTWALMIVGFGLIGAVKRRRGAPTTATLAA